MATPPCYHLAQARAQRTPQETFLDLAAICEQRGIHSSDVYGDYSATPETSFLRSFERQVADFIAHEDCLFAPSGVMSTNVVLSIARKRTQNNRFLCHFSSHVLIHEHDAWRELLGLEAIIVPADPSAQVQQPMTFASFLDTVSKHPAPAAVLLECPHREVGGKCTPLEDIRKISAYCLEHNIHFHMDGARLWEAQAFYPLHELTPLFNSVYMSTYKGLGGMTGALLTGSSNFVAEARVWLRRFGGNVYSMLPYVVAAAEGFHQCKDAFTQRRDILAAAIGEVSAALKQEQLEKEPLIRFDPSEPHVSLVHVYFDTPDASLAMRAVRNVTAATGITVVASVRGAAPYGPRHQVYSEFNLGPANGSIEVKHWVRGYVFLQRELRRLLGSTSHTVSVSEEIAAPAERVWELFRPFAEFDKLTGGVVSQCSIVVDMGGGGQALGSQRRATLGALEVYHELLALDDAQRSISYSIVAGDMPVEHYVASAVITPLDEHRCRCDWWADFVVTDGAKHLRDVGVEHIAHIRDETIKKLFTSTISSVCARLENRELSL